MSCDQKCGLAHLTGKIIAVKKSNTALTNQDTVTTGYAGIHRTVYVGADSTEQQRLLEKAIPLYELGFY